MTEIVFDYTPSERQKVLHSTIATQVFYGGAAGGGKVVEENASVLTPFGYKVCSDLKVGDAINNPDGTVAKIIQLHPWIKKPGWTVHFHDGSSTTVMDEHLWLAWRSGKRKKRAGASAFGEAGAEVVETKGLKEWLDYAIDQESRGIRPNWPCIPVCKEQRFNVSHKHKQYIMDPYLLGVLIGDGHLSKGSVTITSADEDHVRGVLSGLGMDFGKSGISYRLRGEAFQSVRASLAHFGLLGKKSDTKFIPRVYKMGSIETRYSILQGLMDTDGFASEKSCYYTTVSKQLAEDVKFVVQSLGGTATITTKDPFYRDGDGEKVWGKLAYTLYIKMPDPTKIFRLERKLERARGQRVTPLYKRVVKIEVGEPIVGRCITVSHPNGLYITDDFIVTHNSRAIRAEALALCLANPGIQVFLFRRTNKELMDNHIRPMMNEIPEGLEYKFNKDEKRIEFTNKSAVNFCYCEAEHDVTRYQGAEIHVLLVDESSHLTEYQLTYLRTRVRLGSWKPSKEYAKYLPKIIFASNPGNVGHSWLKSTFVDAAPKERLFYDKSTAVEENGYPGHLSIYIPATMEDNPYLDRSYAGQFSALEPELARALREGDWDAVVGKALHNLSRDKHCLRPFTPPKHWTHFMSMDWGTAKPFSIGWYTVSEGAELAARDGHPAVWLPAGAIIRYREWYGWNGKSDRGCRMDAASVARGIVERESAASEVMDFRIADSAMWAQVDGPSPQENMRKATDGRILLRRSTKDRIRNYTEIVSRLAGSPTFREDGREEEHPMFFCTENCAHFWRTMPVLTLDDVDPEKGPGLKQEDHCFAAGTLVSTPRGPAPIERLRTGDLLMTSDGWRRCISLGVTREDEVYRVEFEDGYTCVATGDHKFFLDDGSLVRLDELTYNDKLCQVSHSTGVSFISAASIGAAQAVRRLATEFCTALCGSITTAQYQAANTYTISTEIQTTTTSETSNLWGPLNTYLSTWRRQSVSSVPKNTWKETCGLALLNGMVRQRGWSGTPNRVGGTAPFLRGSLTLAGSVASRVWRKLVPVSIVRTSATKKVSGAKIRAITPVERKRPVYCVNVPGPHNFCLANGVLVRNCYDEVAYGVRSRPYITTEDDRWMAEHGEEMRQARSESVDPYAT